MSLSGGTPVVPANDPRATDIVKALSGSITDVVTAATAADVAADGGLEWSTAVLGEIKKHRDQVESLRVKFVGPLNEHVRFVNGVFKDMDRPLAEADTSLRRRVLDYHKRVAAEQRALADAQQRTAEAAKETAKESTPYVPARLQTKVPLPPPTTVRTALGSSTVRKVMDFEVLDKALVPKEYVTVHDGAVRGAMSLGIREIPGLRIFEREVLVVSHNG